MAGYEDETIQLLAASCGALGSMLYSVSYDGIIAHIDSCGTCQHAASWGMP